MDRSEVAVRHWIEVVRLRWWSSESVAPLMFAREFGLDWRGIPEGEREQEIVPEAVKSSWHMVSLQLREIIDLLYAYAAPIVGDDAYSKAQTLRGRQEAVYDASMGLRAAVDKLVAVLLEECKAQDARDREAVMAKALEATRKHQAGQPKTSTTGLALGNEWGITDPHGSGDF